MLISTPFIFSHPSTGTPNIADVFSSSDTNSADNDLDIEFPADEDSMDEELENFDSTKEMLATAALVVAVIEKNMTVVAFDTMVSILHVSIFK